MNHKKIFLTVFFLFFLFSFCSAEIFVSISPKEKTREILLLYPEETGVLELSVLNSGSAPAKIVLKISAEDSIVFLEKENELTGISRTVELSAGEKTVFELDIKALKQTDKKQLISVQFGVEEFSQSVTTMARIIPSPISFETTEPDIENRNSGKFKAKIINNSNETIQNLKLVAIPQIGLDSNPADFFQISELAPKERIEKEFSFYFNLNSQEQKTIFLQASFQDSNGFHILQRNIKAQYSLFPDVLVFSFALLIVIAIAYLLLAIFKKKESSEEKKKNKKKEEPKKEEKK